MVQILDRRNKALGGQNNTRNKSDIKEIAWHYTATTNSSIENHERYWKNSRGWTYGGYHFYIDRDGNIYQNYNLETVSNGVAGHNSRIVNVCCEASRADNYTQAQIDARHELTVWLMDELNLKASDVKQHGEFSGASTSCAGYSKAQMNEFRARLTGGKVNTQTTVKKPAEVKKQASESKSIAQLADEVIAGKHGQGHSNRRNSLGVSQAEYDKVRAEVNRRAGTNAPTPQKSVKQMADEIIANKHGNGHANRQRSLGVDNATYQKVRAEVNRRAGVQSKPKKSVKQLADEILKTNIKGNAARAKHLGLTLKEYEPVRQEINRRYK